LSGTPQNTGAFSFVIRVTDSAKATVTKSFALTINAASSQGVTLSTSNLDFTALAGGDAPAPQTFAVISTGSQPLQLTVQSDGGAGSPAPAWLSVQLLKASTPARVPVAVDQTGLAPGTYSARVVVNSSDGRQNSVAVTLTVASAAPQLDVAPGYLRFAGSGSALTAAEQDVIIRNTGGSGPLAFQASVTGDAAWLSVMPDGGQAGPNAPAL